MTRKHFESIAAQIRHMTLGKATRRHVAESMADTCAMYNPNFDRGKFLTACGL